MKTKACPFDSITLQFKKVVPTHNSVLSSTGSQLQSDSSTWTGESSKEIRYIRSRMFATFFRFLSSNANYDMQPRSKCDWISTPIGEICSKLTIKTPKQSLCEACSKLAIKKRQWRCSGIFINTLEQISDKRRSGVFIANFE